MFKQSHGHWLFSNSLYVIITMALKLKEEFDMALFVTNLMEDDMSMNSEYAYVFFQHSKKSMWCFRWFSFIPNEVWKEENP